MESQEEWLARLSNEYREALGYPDPLQLKVVRDLGVAFKVQEQELIADAKGLESVPERELRHRLALTLVIHSPEEHRRASGAVKRWLLGSVGGSFALVAGSVAVFGPMGLASLVLIPIGLRATRPQRRGWFRSQSERLHLAAIELTGDAVSALKVIRKPANPRDREGSFAIAKRVEHEARRLGYRIEQEGD